MFAIMFAITFVITFVMTMTWLIAITCNYCLADRVAYINAIPLS